MLRLSKTNTFARALTVRLPTDDPHRFDEAALVIKYRLMPKDELTALASEGDRVLIEKAVVEVTGLGDGEGQPISGEAALAEVLDGKWSGHLQGAIIAELFDQFGDVRVKNSRPLRGR